MFILYVRCLTGRRCISVEERSVGQLSDRQEQAVGQVSER